MTKRTSLDLCSLLGGKLVHGAYHKENIKGLERQESTCCSYRRPRFSSQHLGDLTPLLTSEASIRFPHDVYT